MPNFWVKSIMILSVLANKNSLPVKKLIYLQFFMIFVATKNGRTKKISPPPLLVLLLDPDPGSGMGKKLGSGAHIMDP
jgi:hypothetical protein